MPAEDLPALAEEIRGAPVDHKRILVIGDALRTDIQGASDLVMGLAAHDAVTVDDETMIATSFPTFHRSLAALGARW